MSQSGQQHPKADSGGQRPTPKDGNAKSSAAAESTKSAVDSAKSADAGGKKDAKK
jgi:hypothetical protein